MNTVNTKKTLKMVPYKSIIMTMISLVMAYLYHLKIEDGNTERLTYFAYYFWLMLVLAGTAATVIIISTRIKRIQNSD